MRLHSFIFFLLTCLCARAQQTVTSASVSGMVEDPSGSPVTAVTVTITNTERNQTLRAVTNAQGRYHFLYVAPGTYDLRVSEPRFAPAVKTMALLAGQAVELPVRLTLASLSETVMVSERAELVETTRTQMSENVVRHEIDSLPLNGRNYLDLALLAPGVSRTNTGAPQQFAETSAVPGTGISIGGQRNLNNTFIVDGLSANDDAADLAGTFYSEEVIREFQVITSGGIPEFGRTSSGVLNITTKSGTNDWHGRFYGFLRNQRFDARNTLAKSKDALTQVQHGVSVGGPLRRDKTFLFANFEQTRRHAAGFITISPANVEAINSVLLKINSDAPPISTGEFPAGWHTTNYFARVDHKLNDNNQLALRYSFYDIASPNARGVGGLNAVSRGTALNNRDQTVALNQVTTISSHTLNEVRAQFTRSRLLAPDNSLIGPSISIAGVASFGPSTSSPTGRDLDVYELSDTFSMQRGAHFLKGGADFLYNRVNIVFPGALIAGVYSFSNIANLQAGRYITFQQAFGLPAQFQSNPGTGLFFQDEWKVLPSLTLNMGLRYDLEWLPDPIHTDTGNVAPRFGIAYAPGDRKTVIRASYGLYYGRLPLRATSNALQRNGEKYKTAVLSFGQPGAPVFPQELTAFPAGQYVSISAIDPQILHPHSQEAAIEIDRQIASGLTITAGYQHLRGLHLILARNVNVPTLTAAEANARGIPNLGRPDSRFGNISRYEGSGDSYYNGLLLSIRAQPSRNASVRVSYNYSKSIDNTGNFFFSSPQNNFDLRDDRGLSDNDQRHRLTVSGILQAPARAGSWAWLLRGWQLSPLFLYTSPLPFNVQLGTDRNYDTNSNDRPAGVGRNTGRGFGYTSLDVRVSRGFRLTERLNVDALAEAFNILNHTNFALPNNIFGTGSAPLPNFGRPTAVYDPRQIQFGLRINF